jgi:hypothetical protein
MDIQVNKHQLERVVVKWLNKKYSNLTPKTIEKYPNSVFYVNSDNEVIMEYDKKNENVYIHYDHIWSKIESLFHLNYGETQSIMKVWLEEAYKLGGVTTSFTDEFQRFWLEETYKLKNRIWTYK